MELRLYDTLTREKRVFTPLDPTNVRMYVCGPTVYDFAHIGNARPVIVFDVLFRLLRHLYGENHVTYVRNITDVDDKIIQRAAELGEPISELTTRHAALFEAQMKALGCVEPDHQPRDWPDDAHSSNTWGILPPRSYFRFDRAAVEAEREGLEALGKGLPD